MPQAFHSRDRVELIVAQSDGRLWLHTLIECLEAAGCAVSLQIEPPISASRNHLDAMTKLETKIYRLAHNLWEPLTEGVILHPIPAGEPPRRIALSGSANGADFRVLLDGEHDIGALGERLLNAHVPLIDIIDGAGKIRTAGLPAIEEPGNFSRALNHFSRRLATLILMALDGQHRLPVSGEGMRIPPRGRGATHFLAAGLGKKIAGRVAGSYTRHDHWRVGIRLALEPFQWHGDQHLDGFHWLPDDGARYYADPVLWHEDGRDILFVEEFPYDTGRGIISYTELDELGRPLFVPKPIIERQTHLSYPLIFRHDGTIYMMPENAAEGHVPLYRATRFPDLWEECDALVEGVGLHDATLLEHRGVWWLIANEARDGGSSWDCLCLYRAPSPLGPFVPHPANPLLVDARLARSGGPVLKIDGKLVRPVQNCLGGYGRFLRFTEIDLLSDTGFEQHETGRIVPPMRSQISGVHSYGRNARFEVIDVLTTRQWRGKP